MRVKHLVRFLGFNILVFTVSCSPAKKIVSLPVPPSDTMLVVAPVVETKEDQFFVDLFGKNLLAFDSVLKYRRERNVQIIYTQVDRSSNGTPQLKHFYFNRPNASYFYPASTVKLPVALLALEKVNQLNIPGLTKHSTMITEAAFSGQTAVYNDPNTADGKPTIAQYIKKILLVSDNDAYNRLYEFLGQEYTNTTLHKKGYTDAQILHRLDIFLSEEENRHTNPVKFFDSSNRLVRSFPEQVSRLQYAKRNDSQGSGYYSGGVLQNRPMDFSKKNRLSLGDLHQVLISLILPTAVKASQRFNLTDDDRRLVLQYMSQFPRESHFPYYDSSYHDAYAKFVLYGSEKGKLPGNIRIFNKVGDAYGQLTDVAYVVDVQNKIEFFVSATIYCNSDGILNDDQYDYETVGLPFMKHLGKLLYDHEKARKKTFPADLSPLIFSYDK